MDNFSAEELRRMEERIVAKIESVHSDLRTHSAQASLASQRLIDVSERQTEIMEATLELVRKIAPAFESMGRGASQLQNGALQKLLIRVVLILVASQVLSGIIEKVGVDAAGQLVRSFVTGM